MPLDGTPPLVSTADREILLKAADLLAEDGWCVGRLLSTFGERCINGALRRARGVDEHHYARRGRRRHHYAIWRLYGDEDDRLARLLGFSNAGDAARWNNMAATESRAIDRLRRAAAGDFVSPPKKETAHAA